MRPRSAARLVLLALLGLAGGPIFPALVAATPARLGPAHAANGIGVQIVAATLGQALLSALIGAFAARAGLEAIGVALVTGTLALLVAHEALVRRSERTAPAVPVAAPAIAPAAAEPLAR